MAWCCSLKRLSADMIGFSSTTFKERRQLDDLTGVPPCLTVKGNPVHSGDLAFDNRPLQVISGH